MQPSAIVLLSGGLDSATCLAIARGERRQTLALSFRYGQRHAIELDAARAVAAQLGADEHVIASLDGQLLGGSSLTSPIAVEKHRDMAAPGIPLTYVPARNTVFLALALALAEVRGADAIYLGVNAVDYSGYPDCRPEFVAAFERLAALATRAGVEGRPTRICAPLLHWTKDRIIARGLELGVDFGLTRSCYDPDAAGRACGGCDSCRLRLEAFARLGRRDPAPYQGT